MIAACEPELIAATMFALLPPLPANAVPATKVSARTIFGMTFMAPSLVRRGVGGVLAGGVVHAHVGREDELVELGGRQLGVASDRGVRRRRERADRRVGRREQLRRVDETTRRRVECVGRQHAL